MITNDYTKIIGGNGHFYYADDNFTSMKICQNI